jgi:hemerythrin-like metal-binding protein
MAGSQFIVWKDEYEVGHAELDAHHRRLIEIINSLYEAAMAGASADQVDETVRQMDGYAAMHFRAEEAALHAARYPGLDGHRRAHEAYTRRLDDLKRSFFLPSGGLSQEILQFLKEWWLTHILRSDKEYAPFLSMPE